MGMVTSLLTAGPHGSTPFSSVTAAFPHKEWRHLVRAPREGDTREVQEPGPTGSPEAPRSLLPLPAALPRWSWRGSHLLQQQLWALKWLHLWTPHSLIPLTRLPRWS
uniref:Uncharacterized protein n=1 Tax=Myotis myotis TaxID=51298 RepID=A0A7J7US37_MYOMY|nr:hypothetical protein mMyoMyo1_021207 [Myotis myotis]